MNTKYDEIDNKQLYSYLVKLHKRVFKILYMFEEECETLDVYIDSLVREMLGNSKIFMNDELLSIIGTIKGISFDSHRLVKSDINKACGIIESLQKRVK